MAVSGAVTKDASELQCRKRMQKCGLKSLERIWLGIRVTRLLSVKRVGTLSFFGSAKSSQEHKIWGQVLYYDIMKLDGTATDKDFTCRIHYRKHPKWSQSWKTPGGHALRLRFRVEAPA